MPLDMNAARAAAQAAVTPPFIQWSKLAGKKAPPRRFILPDWIPQQSVTLLHGFGGVGKTLWAQQLGVKS